MDSFKLQLIKEEVAEELDESLELFFHSLDTDMLSEDQQEEYKRIQELISIENDLYDDDLEEKTIIVDRAKAAKSKRERKKIPKSKKQAAYRALKKKPSHKKYQKKKKQKAKQNKTAGGDPIGKRNTTK